MSTCSQLFASVDEALQEQRAGDRAGKAAGRRVVDVGDLRIEPRIVRPATAAGATADRSPLRASARRRRPASRHWCRTAADPARAPPAPRRSACPGRPADPAFPRRPAPARRPGPAGPRRRCCRSRRSSPLRDVKISSGRKALPATAFSTAGISTRSRTFSLASITICASASTLAAPPMSFFMISMPLDGLRSSPPVSKQTPLPTSVTLGCAGSPQVRSISRGARVEARPTAWISGKFCSQQIVADDAVELGAEARRELLARPAPVPPAPCRWPAC